MTKKFKSSVTFLVTSEYYLFLNLKKCFESERLAQNFGVIKAVNSYFEKFRKSWPLVRIKNRKCVNKVYLAKIRLLTNKKGQLFKCAVLKYVKL